VKLIRARLGKFVFEMTPQEKKLLDEMLHLYPLVSSTHHRLSKKPKPGQADENQQLLEESLAAQRELNRKNVRAMLEQPGHFQSTAAGCQLALSRPEIEWLLQVLNDVRVGSWIALGSPDPDQGSTTAFNEKTMPHFRAMELAGAFQMVFLDALRGR
jgi:hypothetical protein